MYSLSGFCVRNTSVTPTTELPPDVLFYTARQRPIVPFNVPQTGWNIAIPVAADAFASSEDDVATMWPPSCPSMLPCVFSTFAVEIRVAADALLRQEDGGTGEPVVVNVVIRTAAS